jgi:hypothetical protein
VGSNPTGGTTRNYPSPASEKAAVRRELDSTDVFIDEIVGAVEFTTRAAQWGSRYCDV